MWRFLFRTKIQTGEASGCSVSCVSVCVSAWWVGDDGMRVAMMFREAAVVFWKGFPLCGWM